MLDRTKCKPMQFEWEHFSDERERASEREREKGFRRGVRRQYSGPSGYICQYYRFLKQASSTTETNFSCSPDRNVNQCILNVSQTIFVLHGTKRERERKREMDNTVSLPFVFFQRGGPSDRHSCFTFSVVFQRGGQSDRHSC